MSDLGTATVTVTRKHENDVRDRQVVVSIDGEPFATLMYGQEVTKEFPSGPYRIKAHNTLFWKTIDLDLKPGEHARLIVINRAGTGTFSLLGMLGVGPLYLTFERQDEPSA